MNALVAGVTGAVLALALMLGLAAYAGPGPLIAWLSGGAKAGVIFAVSVDERSLALHACSSEVLLPVAKPAGTPVPAFDPDARKALDNLIRGAERDAEERRRAGEEALRRANEAVRGSTR